MKKVIYFLVLVFISCNNSHDFNKIIPGINEKQVIEFVGEPIGKQKVFTIDYWAYDTHIIIIESGVVINCITTKEMKKGLEDFNNDLSNTIQ